LISIRRMSLGSGFRYLMESVATGDGAPMPSDGLTRYYAESGTPPGVFLGAGLAGLGAGAGVEKGATVTEEHLYRMLGLCADPVTGLPLGRPPNNPTRPAAVGAGDVRRGSSADAHEGSGTSKPAARRTARVPVAGFDLTFSPSKSVSAAWAVANEDTKAVIYDCHRRAIDYVIAYAEKEVFHSRSGTNGVVTEDIEGIVAAAFTHWDSRAGDPQLHDHVVVLNRAKSTSDGVWRTLDSRGLFKQTVALSELHQGVLSDLLTAALGWGWEGRARRHSPAPRWEVTGVAESLVREFSQRSDAIEARTDALIGEFSTVHGRRPAGPELLRLRQQATLETRPDKAHRSLSEMTGRWQGRAEGILGTDDPVAWISTLADRNDLPLLTAGDLHDEILADVACVAADTVAAHRSTFTRANVTAEVHRQLHGVRFATPDDRVTVAGRTVDLALRETLTVTAPDLHHAPDRFRRPDGTSRFHTRDHLVYTTTGVLDAEARLLDAARDKAGPTVRASAVAAVAGSELAKRPLVLAADQANAVTQIALSGRVVDVLVGPAGTGKSTALAGLRAAWEADHGADSVLGLAPSAAAAEVLAGELGIETENLAKWSHEHHQTTRRLTMINDLRRRRAATTHPGDRSDLRNQLESLRADAQRWSFKPGQLIIVDEASLAGTLVLDELVTAARAVGAKVVLVGDTAQLTGVTAGGMFRTLVADRDGEAPSLTDVRRFRNEWERAASVELRAGRESAIDTYIAHERVEHGTRSEMLDALFQAWKADTAGGMTSLMIAADTATVVDLNGRARADRLAAGQVISDGVTVADGHTAGVGDLVITRQNDRRLATGGKWVKNGDCWTVTATHDDGTMTVSRHGNAAGQVVLPAEYVRTHVELGYATTAHRAQGRTVDSAHVMVSPATTREALYVAATRGRDGNRLYVDTAWDPDPDTAHPDLSEAPSVGLVLAGVLQNEGADVSAHDAIRRSQAEADSIARLVAEYQTLAQAAQADRWNSLLARSGFTDGQVAAMQQSEAHGPLVAAFRDAEARGLDIDNALPALVTGRTLIGVDDVASVLHGRVDRWIEASGGRRNPSMMDLVAGLIPRASNVADPDMRQALQEREQAMEQRAWTLTDQALESCQPWMCHFGQPPSDPGRRLAWQRHLGTVAAYRERWSVSGPRPLGDAGGSTSVERQIQHKRAQAAVDRAIAITRAYDQSQVVDGPVIAAHLENGVEP
jgi:conjugative relaxase-like TrwC/TraI family protein